MTNNIFKFHRCLPWVLYLVAVILALCTWFSSNFLNAAIIFPLLNQHLQIEPTSVSISQNQVLLTDVSIHKKDTIKGRIDKLYITPDIKNIVNRYHKKILVSGGLITINPMAFLLDPAQATNLIRAIQNTSSILQLDNLYIEAGNLTLKIMGNDKRYSINLKKNQNIHIMLDENCTKINCPYISFPHVSLRDMTGTIIHSINNTISGKIKAYAPEYKTNLDVDLKLSPTLHEAQGAVSTDENTSIGKFSFIYTPETHQGILTANIHNLQPKIIPALVPELSTFAPLKIKGGKTQFLADIAINHETPKGQVKLKWTEGTAKLFFYDITGITADLPVTTFGYQDNITIKAEKIIRNKLNLTKVSVIAKPNTSLGIFPEAIDAAFCKGHIHLYDFKHTSKGISAKIKFTGIDIDDLIRISSITALAATGKLSGSGTVLLDQSKIKFINLDARASSSSGKIHYLPLKQSPTEDDNSEALSDLDYTVLNLSLQASEQDDAPGQVTIRVIGSNPGFSRGTPLDFTIETQGNFGDFF